MEDDAILKNNFIDCYNELLNFDKDNFLIKLNIDEAEGKILSLFGRVNLHNFSLKKEAFNFWSAYSYYIDIKTARMILENHPKIDSVADDFFNYLAKNVKIRICLPICAELNTNVVSTIEDERAVLQDIVNETIYRQFGFPLVKIMRLIKHKIKFYLGIINPFN